MNERTQIFAEGYQDGFDGNFRRSLDPEYESGYDLGFDDWLRNRQQRFFDEIKIDFEKTSKSGCFVSIP